jgi:hypothetical protein
LGALVAGLIHARDCLTELFLGFYRGCVHDILHGTKDGAAGKGGLAGGFHPSHFVYAAASNIHPPVGSGGHIADCFAAGGNDGTRKISVFGSNWMTVLGFTPNVLLRPQVRFFLVP